MNIPKAELLARIDQEIESTRGDYRLSDEEGDHQWARNYGFKLEGLQTARRIIAQWPPAPEQPEGLRCWMPPNGGPQK